LLSDASGNLFGAANGPAGAVYGSGSVFKLDGSNNYAFSTVWGFGGLDGSQLYGPLISDASGNFYGTTLIGGSYGLGNVYELDASNAYRLNVLDEVTGSDGSTLFGGLLQDAAGNLYGTTSGEDIGESGTVFMLDSSHAYALSTLHTFNDTD